MSIWGVANPLAVAAAYASVGGADVTCTAGSEITVVTTGAITANNPGNYYPIIWGALSFAFGASAPTALVVAFKIGSGADVATYTVAPALLANNGTIVVPVVLVGTNSSTAWVGSGSTINITALATTNAATLKNVGSTVIVLLQRGIDA